MVNVSSESPSTYLNQLRPDKVSMLTGRRLSVPVLLGRKVEEFPPEPLTMSSYVTSVVNKPRFGCYSLGHMVQLDCTS
jgi:hypothetical protein